LSVPFTVPQFLPTRVQNAVSLSAKHPQTFAVTAPHVKGAVQPKLKLQSGTVRLVPQLSVPVTLPQFFPSLVQNAALVSGPHPQANVALHAWVPAHVPQLKVRVVPQLSFSLGAPQDSPILAQCKRSVSAAHPHTLAVPPPAQVFGAVHAVPKPQSATVRVTLQFRRR
jgi:hypothetical protein